MSDASARDWPAAPRANWSDEEVTAAVLDYFHMLRLELAGQAYNKSHHRKRLLQLLAQRSESSVELKHQNISAVLLDLGVMPIRGYKPRFNYQALLAEKVAAFVASDHALDVAAIAAVAQHAEAPVLRSFSDFLVPHPIVKSSVNEERQAWVATAPMKRDYLEREAKNQALGLAGELLAVQFEVDRLYSLGLKKLSDRVEHCSSTQGDGLGFDILSFEEDGKERFIEVKTTAFNSSTPFFLSENERLFSKAHAAQFQLYRIFEFRDRPRMYTLAGAVEARCRLHPISYRAVPAG